jgi:hypothetical protein
MPALPDLASRTELPADLRALVEKFPRATWRDHANLGATARFWLSRHAMFRELGRALKDSTQSFRDGAVAPPEFLRFFAPRLSFFLEGLEGHHHIEDLHYFPLFRAAEARLSHGFDLLEGDHDAIHRQIAAVVETANRMIQAFGDAERRLSLADRHAGEADRLLAMLLRHLDDEEDLIVPIILQHGERRLLAPGRSETVGNPSPSFS